MPHSAQAKKRVRQNAQRNLINRGRRSALRTQIKRFEQALEKGDLAAAQTEFNQTTRSIDKAIKGNLIHRNVGARKKSNLAQRLNALKASSA